MSIYKGTLVFFYPGGRIARNKVQHYSGLTQAYYALALFEAYQVTQIAEILTASRQVYESLKVPSADGGVLFSGRNGVTIAEVPQEPGSWILNGWLSVLVALEKYAEATGSADAKELLKENLESLRRKLPLYDNPRYQISNYGLTGFAYFRLLFSEPEPIERVGDISYEIPGEGRFPLKAGPAGRWEYFQFPGQLDVNGKPSGTAVKLNLVVSRASGDLENVLWFTTTARKDSKVTLEGDYLPTKSAATTGKWKRVGALEIKSGTQLNRLSIPWNALTLSAIYPTNFVKKIDGRNVNVYHAVHINQLLLLYRKFGYAEFRDHAERWTRYVCSWQAMKIYQGLVARRIGPVDVEKVGADPAANCP